MKHNVSLIILSFLFVLLSSGFSFGPFHLKKDGSYSGVQKDTVKDTIGGDSSVVEDGITFTLFKKKVHASYYADKFTGRKTASGERFDNTKYTAAHKKLPFGTRVRVTNEANGRSVIVTINDRGPFVKGREIDLSQKAFREIARGQQYGTMKVTLELVTEETPPQEEGD